MIVTNLKRVVLLNDMLSERQVERADAWTQNRVSPNLGGLLDLIRAQDPPEDLAEAMSLLQDSAAVQKLAGELLRVELGSDPHPSLWNGLLRGLLLEGLAAYWALPITGSRPRDRSTYAFKVGRRWCVPRELVADGAFDTRWSETLECLRSSITPAELLDWLHRPGAELERDDGTLATPAQWMREGGDPEALVEQALVSG